MLLIIVRLNLFPKSIGLHTKIYFIYMICVKFNLLYQAHLQNTYLISDPSY